METLKTKQQAIEFCQKYKCVEIWQWTQDRRYCKSYPYPHTDSIEFIVAKIEDIPECAFGEDTYALIMDADEYNHTIYANCGETTDEEQTLVVMLPYHWQERKGATIRNKVREAINDYDEDDLRDWLIERHRSQTCRWVEVYPDGDIIVAEEPDSNTRHYIDYPHKGVAWLYHIANNNARYCNCDVCVQYQHFEELDEIEFIELYDADSYEYCSDVSYEDAIIDYYHDSDIYEDDIRDEMLKALDEIPYGYFNDEDDDE